MPKNNNPAFIDGDLVEISYVEHDSIPKKFAIMGQFKGKDDMIILARVGEGPDDPRPQEIISMTAEYVAKEIASIYGTMVALRVRQEAMATRKVGTSGKRKRPAGIKE